MRRVAHHVQGHRGGGVRVIRPTLQRRVELGVSCGGRGYYGPMGTGGRLEPGLWGESSGRRVTPSLDVLRFY